jgi:pyridoxine 5-phosphate synthase
MKKRLGVNVDHVATLRQARKESFPDPLEAALIAEKAGADSIVVHLREDRRHIQDEDVLKLRKGIRTVLNLEMSTAPEIVKVALHIHPPRVCLVPERREEVTTEGGLNVVRDMDKIKEVVEKLKDEDIFVSLFVDPDKKQIKAAKLCDADAVEIHTGRYAENYKNRRNMSNRRACKEELHKIKEAAKTAHELGLEVHAGHGLDYENIVPLLSIPEIVEFNIGFSIIARALFVGLYNAVRQMKDLIRGVKEDRLDVKKWKM